MERGILMRGTRRLKIRYLSAALITGAAAAAFASRIAARGEAVRITPGDINVDNEINVRDGVMLARSCAEDDTLEITALGKRNADINRDGNVKADDLSLLIRQLAERVPFSDPYDDESVETTVTEATATTTTTSTTVTFTETTTVSTEDTTTTVTVTTPPVISDSPVLTVDDRTLPLDVSLSKLTGDQAPDELLTVQYKTCNMTFAIYADDPAHTLIGISANDLLIGYYAIGARYTAPEGYKTVEYIDKNSAGSGELYAILVLKDGYSIKFGDVADQNNYSVLSKLNYYGVNGVRALNGLPGYIWDEELAKVALAHSREMADNDFFEHNSLDGTKFSARLLNAGIDWSVCAENIDCGYNDPFAALNGWYNSESGHRKNILSEKYTNFGVGFAYNPDSYYGYYGTQDFYKGW